MGELTRQLGAPAPEKSAAPAANRLRGDDGVLGAVVHEDVIIPRTNIRGKMRLLRRTEAFEAKASAIAAMKGLPEMTWRPGGVAYEDWNAAIAVRTLAIAVRNTADVTKPLDDVDAWGDLLDDEQIGALFDQYEDMRVRLDPLAHPIVLTQTEVDQFEAAVKKKDADLLRSFGLRKLSSFTASLADRLATSPTPK